MTARDYGPHRPEDAPQSVPVLRVVARVRYQNDEPLPRLLVEQRRAINTRAYRAGQEGTP